MTRRRVFALALAAVLFAALFPLRAGAEGKAGAYIVMERGTGRVLMGHNTKTRMSMASTTKIMTCLIALERADPQSIVTVPREAVGVEGSSVYLKEGERLSLESLLYCLMLSSGNDAAVAVAVAVAGSVQAFVDIMNEKAQSLGAYDTHFMNPHGLDDEGHYTTAYDMALIARAAYDTQGFLTLYAH